VRKTRRPMLWLGLTLMLLAASCATGCVGRPYAAYRGVAVFTDATWAQDADGGWHLVSAKWTFEKPLTAEDVRYQFREGRVLTPGWLEEIMNRLEERNKP